MTATVSTEQKPKPAQQQASEPGKLYWELTPEETAAADLLKIGCEDQPLGGLMLKAGLFDQRVIDYQTGSTLTWD